MVLSVWIVQNKIHGSIQISQGTRDSLIYIVKAPAKKIYSFNISEENIKELEIISKIYTNDKLENEYKI